MPHFDKNTTAADVVAVYPSMLAGKTIVITGPSLNSLAAEAAYSFVTASPAPAEIILLGRSIARIQPVLDKLKQLNPSVSTSIVPLDLGSNASVRKAASEIQTKVSKVDVLVNSAGIMAPEKYSVSEDGIGLQFAACHTGHFLLTALLLPQLRASGDARVVTLTSMGYEVSPPLLDDYNFSNGSTYDPWMGYGQAKSANILFTTELARRAKAQKEPITALVLHPGIILSSGILQNTNMDSLGKAFQEMVQKAKDKGEEYVPEEPKTIEQGAATTVVAAMQPDLQEKSGAFLKDCVIFEESKQKPWIKDAKLAKDLWELSERLVGEQFL
ncbi:short-chain dehydrogenase [Elsinoe ampelina]|uniref:Short-chain dehydrogenase n=1 Tax=Elsinoe ampelina TaxID=302913 RepID=A0A6A6GC34_9PEZI|nr:short-chain dehydrogenase [Elsinoe ampelina]